MINDSNSQRNTTQASERIKELLIGDSPVRRIPQNSQIQDFSTKNPPILQKISQTIQITVLNGVYKGKTLKIGEWLGVGIEEVSHTSGAEWSPIDAKGIRNSATFKKLSDRTFSLKLVFYDFLRDISELVENLQVLTEITDGEVNPPTLTLKQGKLVATPVVCQGIRTSYKTPHGGEEGYKYAEVDLDFLLLGGRSSEHALSAPLASTPLANVKRQETKQEREKKGTIAVVEQTLAPCLGKQGNSEVEDLIQNDKLKDQKAIANLSSKTFIQIAIAGMIPAEILNNSSIKDKLRQDIATALASKEEGIPTGLYVSDFIDALKTGSVSGLPIELQMQTQEAIEDYNLILDAITSQDLNDSSNVFAQINQRAGNRLRALGRCGISLRKINASSTVGESFDRDRVTLAKLKLFLEKVNKGEIKNDEAKSALGLTKDSDLKAIKNGAPYKSKKEFLERIYTNGSIGLAGQAVWGKFTKYDIPETTE